MAIRESLSTAIEYGLSARRHLHVHPELSGAEFSTANFLRERLLSLGYCVEACGTPPSFLAYFSEGAELPWLGLRAEMDALPIQESLSHALVSETAGVMHACGHDLHCGIAMAAAYSYAHLSADEKGNLRWRPLFIFESSEEVIPGGASSIIQSDPFQRLAPRVCLAFHSDPALPVGTVGTRPGPFLASGDEVDIALKGRGGHGAIPQLGDDLLLIAAHLLVAFQAVTSRFAPPDIPTVLSFGRLTHSSSSMNSFPTEVLLEGTLRAHGEAWRKESKMHIRRIAEHVASAYGVKAVVTIREGYPSLYQSSRLIQALGEALQPVASLQFDADRPIRMTTDDFAYFAQQGAAALIRLGVGQEAGALHTAEFCPDERALHCGLEAYIACLQDLMF